MWKKVSCRGRHLGRARNRHRSRHIGVRRRAHGRHVSRQLLDVVGPLQRDARGIDRGGRRNDDGHRQHPHRQVRRHAHQWHGAGVGRCPRWGRKPVPVPLRQHLPGQPTLPSDPDVYNGTMVDQFQISGSGPIHVSNGFRGTTVENFAAGMFSVDPIWIKGDPRTFPDLAVRCDPTLTWRPFEAGASPVDAPARRLIPTFIGPDFRFGPTFDLARLSIWPDFRFGPTFDLSRPSIRRSS